MVLGSALLLTGALSSVHLQRQKKFVFVTEVLGRHLLIDSSGQPAGFDVILLALFVPNVSGL